jgi:hypothetical protein
MTMTIAQFEDALDRCGADLSVWPVGLRAEAAGLLKADPVARRSHGEAERLAGVLSQAMTTRQLTAPQLGRLVLGLETRRRAPAQKRLFSQRQLAALLGLGILVFSAGAWTGSSVAQDVQEVEIAFVDLDAAGLGFDR